MRRSNIYLLILYTGCPRRNAISNLTREVHRQNMPRCSQVRRKSSFTATRVSLVRNDLPPSMWINGPARFRWTISIPAHHTICMWSTQKGLPSVSPPVRSRAQVFDRYAKQQLSLGDAQPVPFRAIRLFPRADIPTMTTRIPHVLGLHSIKTVLSSVFILHCLAFPTSR